MKLPLPFLIVAFALTWALPAKAELTFCNETSDVQSISVGYKSGDNWQSEGWWNIDPETCKDVVVGDLQQQFYYYRAEVDGGSFSGGGYFFCTSNRKFTIIGDTDCDTRGYDREDYQVVDTGRISKSFTVNLTAEMMAAAQDETNIGLQFCNETGRSQALSIGYEGDEAFTSEGWWLMEPGECSHVIRDELKLRYYYYRIEHDGGEFEGEGYFFCTSDKAYTIVGDEDCETRGYSKEDFREIDTGPTAVGYTHTLEP